jgi:hypothetical protein
MKLTKDELYEDVTSLLRVITYTDARLYEPITRQNTDAWLLNEVTATVEALNAWIKGLDDEA